MQGKIIQEQKYTITKGQAYPSRTPPNAGHAYSQQTIRYDISKVPWYKWCPLPDEPFVLPGLAITYGVGYFKGKDVISVLESSVSYKCRAFLITETFHHNLFESTDAHRLICYFSHDHDLLRFRLKLG